MGIARLLLAALLLAASFGAAAVTMPRFDKLEEALDLTPEQKAQYDVAVAATRRVVTAMAIAGLEMKERLREELAKPRPDLGVLAELREAFIERPRPLREAARAEWAKLYAMLNDEQVALIRSFLEARIERLGELHGLILDLILGPPRKDKPYYW